MADRNGNLINGLELATVLRHPGAKVQNYGVRGTWREYRALPIGSFSSGSRTAGAPVTAVVNHDGNCIGYAGDKWFEAVHIFPRFIDFGQILTQVDRSIEIVNRFRRAARTLSVINIPISGMSIIDAPSLPWDIQRMNSLVMTLRTTIDGPPIFSDSLQFTTDIYDLFLPVEGLRVTMFAFTPETPVREHLLFLTGIIQKADGNEQRINLRKAPRQVFEFLYRLDEETQRSRFESRIFDWHARVFGVPVWWEPTFITSPVSAGDTVINVESTAYSDYRVGGLFCVVQDEVTFDVLEVASFTGTTITAVSVTQNSYAVGVKVYPLRPAYTDRSVDGARYNVGLADYQMRFRVENNDVDLKSAAAFSTYNGKVLLDGPNWQPNPTAPSRWERDIAVVDAPTGRFRQFSTWDVSRRTSQVGFIINGSRQALWETRQLLHYLKGRQLSFYLPTFMKDLTVINDLIEAQFDLDIVNVGFARFIQQRNPYGIIRITETDGTIHTRNISSSAEVDNDEEGLVVDVAWPAGGIAAADIEKVDYYELVRIDSDNIVIEHLSGAGDAQIVVPVKTVLD